jgi:cobalamin biosynthesis Mg chelatase CobN
MRRTSLSLVILATLLVFAVAAVAQTPMTNAPGPTVNKKPFEATSDHPNPGSPAPGRVTETGSTPATTTQPSSTAETPSSTAAETPPSSTTPSSTASSSDTTSGSTMASTPSSSTLPKTASGLPLLGALGLLALSGGLLARSLHRRNV